MHRMIMRKVIIATTVLWPIVALGQSFDQGTAQMIMSSQQSQVPGGECSSNSPCQTQGLVPITFQQGDVILQGSVTDAVGNTWSLAPTSCNGNSPSNWWSGLSLNGVQQWCGYGVALRNVGGDVWYEEAKGSGWKNLSAEVASGILSGCLCGPYVTNPGQGSGTSAADTTVPQPSVVASVIPASASSVEDNCPIGGLALNAITPGSGTFTDSSGNTYAIDTNGNTATINGQPITPYGESTNTGQMAMTTDASGNSIVVGQDATTGQWFAMTQGPGGDRPYAWQPLASLPQVGQDPTFTARWDTPQPGSASVCAGATTASGSQNPTDGTQNPTSGQTPDIIAICTAAPPGANATFLADCASAANSLAQAAALNAQIVAAQQAATTASTAASAATPPAIPDTSSGSGGSQ